MSDLPFERFPQNPYRVDLSDEWDVEFWVNAFGVPRDDLIDAVRRVGNHSDRVADLLGRPFDIERYRNPLSAPVEQRESAIARAVDASIGILPVAAPTIGIATAPPSAAAAVADIAAVAEAAEEA